MLSSITESHVALCRWPRGLLRGKQPVKYLNIQYRLFDNFLIRSITRRCIITTAFNCVLVYAVRKIQESQVRLKLYGKDQILVYFNGVSLLGSNIDSRKKNLETLVKLNLIEEESERMNCGNACYHLVRQFSHQSSRNFEECSQFL